MILGMVLGIFNVADKIGLYSEGKISKERLFSVIHLAVGHLVRVKGAERDDKMHEGAWLLRRVMFSSIVFPSLLGDVSLATFFWRGSEIRRSRKVALVVGHCFR